MDFIKKVKNIIPVSLHLKFIVLFILTIFGIFLELLGIGLVLPIITIVITGDFNFNFGFGIDHDLSNFFTGLSESQIFIYPLIFLLVAYAVKAIYLFFLSFYNAKFCYLLNIKLSESIYKNYLHQEYLFHLKKNSSDLIRIVIAEINFFIKSIILPLLIVVMEILVFIGITVLLLMVETESTLYVISIFFILGLIYFLLISKKLTKWGSERIYHENMKLKNITQGLNGIKIVKIFNREKTFLKHFNLNSFRSAKVGQYAAIFSQVPRLSIEFIAVFLIVAFMIYNIENSSNLTDYFPKLALFAAAAFRLLPSINRLVNNLQVLKYASPVVNKIYKEFPLKESSENLKKNNFNFKFDDEISIKNLSFKYPENKDNILENININIKSGESIGLVGTTGSGKSTLIDIICGLLTPQSGQILVDNKNINNSYLSWQKIIGYVPQNVYLLDDTIRQNIIFGKEQKNKYQNDETLNSSIKSAQLDNFISKLPEGLETTVGERGARLSGGQIQRIGIARALNNDAKLLIFDESTSALDSKTEQELINDINKLKINKTLIIISHRMSVLENCDRVYEIKNKNIYLKK